MRFAEDVLLEIVDIVRQGLSEGRDVSDLLRRIDLDVRPEPGEMKLSLSGDYLAQNGRPPA